MSANPYPRGITNRERKILRAFGQGRAASEQWRLRSENPYSPSNADLYDSWNAGWGEDEVAYTVAPR